MCGRFESKKIDKAVLDQLMERDLKLEVDSEIEKRGVEDIRPTQKILSILTEHEAYLVKKVNWGIKFKSDSPLIFNSRIETIKEKEYWSRLFSNNKCIIPMSGYYEWKTEGKKKTKYRIFLPDQEVFYTAGIYHIDKSKGIYASMITTEANKFASQVHHRMPIILDLENALGVLNDDYDNNLERCVPYDDSRKMEMEAVV